MTTSRRHTNRSGSVLVFSALLMVLMFATLAFSVDLGYLQVIQTQLQASADATALAATWDLIDDDVLAGTGDQNAIQQRARSTAAQYAGLNLVGGESPTLGNAAYESPSQSSEELGYALGDEDDVRFYFTGDPSNPATRIDANDPSSPPANTVRIRIRRTDTRNGAVPLFFARVLGFDHNSMESEATAMFMANLSGFTAPTSGGNLNILPFALDKDTWDDLMARTTGSDGFLWDPVAEEVRPGVDGILEVNLYPVGGGAPGNRGTVDIGNTNNAVPDIRRQILTGINAADMAAHIANGRSLTFDCNGELFLNGDTGISAGVKTQLGQIIGQPRIIPLFTQLSGNGNNAEYTIVGFAGVRIVEVQMTGGNKRVMIQSAHVSSEGMVPPTDTAQKSYFIHTPVYLVP